MSKIIITKKQAEFIEGFKERYFWSKEEEIDFDDILPVWASQALRKLTQFGFCKGLEDANGKEVSGDIYDQEGNFQHDQVPLLIEAVMHGYEVEEKYVVLYIEFSEKGLLERHKLYYGININVTNKDNATPFDLNVKPEKEKVKELEAQGWKVEEV